MQPASSGSLGPQKHDNGGAASAIDRDGVGRGKNGSSAKGTNACASPTGSTRPQSNAQSIIDEESRSASASSKPVNNLEITKAESGIRPFAARGPGDRPVAGKTQISRRGENPQAIQGQTPQPAQGQTSQPPHGQMPQSIQGQKSQPTQEQTPQPKQERVAQPTQGQTSQPAREQTSQSPEQQTPQTTGGQKPPANKPKRRRVAATTATSATTTGSKR